MVVLQNTQPSEAAYGQLLLALSTMVDDSSPFSYPAFQNHANHISSSVRATELRPSPLMYAMQRVYRSPSMEPIHRISLQTWRRS